MKSATLFLASVLIFVLSTSPSLSTSILTVDDDVVFDSRGNPLEKDVGYIISPPLWGPLGGPLKLATPSGNNETCEADVIQIPSLIGTIGTPFTFTSVNPSEDVIKLGSPLAIQSPTKNPCEDGHSTVWKVSNREGLLPTIITTGGTINTGPSCFRIAKPMYPFVANSYEFEYCPYLCGGAKICQRVGVFTTESYVTHLSVNAVSPFQFILVKNPESAAN